MSSRARPSVLHGPPWIRTLTIAAYPTNRRDERGYMCALYAMHCIYACPLLMLVLREVYSFFRLFHFARVHKIWCCFSGSYLCARAQLYNIHVGWLVNGCCVVILCFCLRPHDQWRDRRNELWPIRCVRRTLFDIRHHSRNSGLCNLNLSFTALASPYTNIYSHRAVVSRFALSVSTNALCVHRVLVFVVFLFSVYIVTFAPCVQPYFSCRKLYTFFSPGCLWRFRFVLSGFRVSVFVAERMN